MKDREVRVRFAPSPTGPLHIGGVRTALYNYLFARKNNGKFLLRIEDTDQNRYVKGAEEYIINSLKWCGLDIDEGPHLGGDFGPYRQSDRKDLYRSYADKLIKEGFAYYAFDTSKELDEMRERMKQQGVPSPQYNSVTRQYMKNSLTLSADEVQSKLEKNEAHVIRINVPRNEEIKVQDKIRGWVSFNSSQVDDKVIFKSDGMPTYHLANVVDDYLMKISHVIRGEEWLPSTPVHVLLYKFLGWEKEMPEFAHLPLILRPDGNGKLSKRDGDRMGFPVYPLEWTDPETREQSSGFKEKGFFPEPFLNMLAFLGWNPGTEKEIFTLPELIDAFTLERIGKAGAKFDFEKAKWYNQQYLKNIDNKNLSAYFKPVIEEKKYTYKQDFVEKVAELLKERLVFISDFWDNAYYFYELPKKYDDHIVQKKWNGDKKKIFLELISVFSLMEVFSSANIEIQVKTLMEKYNLKFGDVLPVLRNMISGQAGGPPLFDIIGLLGKETVLERMKIAIESFDNIVTQKV